MAAALGMQVNRLSQDELSYELAIRGVSTEGTVRVMRKNLSSILKIEKRSTKISFPAYPFTFEQDTQALARKIDELTPLIEAFSDYTRSATYIRLHSKLLHAIGRADRVKASSNDDKKQHIDLLLKLQNLMSDLNKRAKAVGKANSSGTILDLSMVNLSDGSSSEVSDGDDADVAQCPTGNVAVKSVPVCRWDLKFSGEPKTMSLSAFLSRVEELRVARNVTYDQLFSSAFDLFSGRALVWFSAVRRTISSWNELVTHLRTEFQPPNYDEQLFEEMKRRTQGSDETIGMFVAVMSVYFDRLEQIGCPLNESARLKFLLRNLTPYNQQQLSLVTITSVEQLKKVGRQIEQARASVSMYAPPPNKTKLLEPDLAYCSVDVQSVGSSSGNSNNLSLPNVVCFNCRKMGHVKRDCREPFRKNCYRCGYPNVTVTNCPRCQGNARRRN